MKKILLVLIALLFHVSLLSQTTPSVGLLVMIEDSLTHHFIGSSEANNFIQKYPATTDFQGYAMDTALVLLEENFPKWDFCTMDNDFSWFTRRTGKSLGQSISGISGKTGLTPSRKNMNWMQSLLSAIPPALPMGYTGAIHILQVMEFIMVTDEPTIAFTFN
jgi:hypothetical protein